MKSILALACGLVLTSLTGCRAPEQHPSGNHLVGAHNLWANRAFQDMAVHSAVTRERTLYSHHFVEGRAELNQLGRRDLGLLAGLFRGRPGSLNVRRGGADEDLYQARLDLVRSELELLGVEAALVDLSDELPGGDGTSSDRASEVLEAGTALGLPTAAGIGTVGGQQ